MKINLGTVLLIGGAIYLLTRPKVAVAVDPITNEPIADEPEVQTLENGVDIYTTDAAGQQVYHHTEVKNPDGTTDYYMLNPTTGIYDFVQTKIPKSPGTTNVAGIKGLRKTRSAANMAII